MNNTHYIQIVKDSQHYTKLNQIKWALERLQDRMYGHQEPGIYLTTIKEDFEYILKAVENTDKLYKLIKRKT